MISPAKLASFLAAFVLLIQPCSGQHMKPANIDSTLASFKAKDQTPLEILLELGRQEHLPLGIVVSDLDLIQTEISIDITNATIKTIFLDVLSKIPNYTATQNENGVVRVFSTTRNYTADMRLENFEVSGGDNATFISERLWGELQFKLNPQRTGYGGILHVPPEDRFLPPLKLKGASVSDVLDWIAEKNGALAWVIWPPPGSLINAPQYRLWNLIYYGDNGSAWAHCCLYVPSDLKSADAKLQTRFSEHR